MSRQIALAAVALAACTASTHATRPSTLGTPRRTSDLVALLDTPGPIELETVASVDWEVPLSGLVNLSHPKAKEAALVDRPEPIQVFFHVIRHPSRGTFLVDTGFERALRDDHEHAAIRGIVTTVMNFEKVTFHVPLADWVAKEPKPLAGVMLTHLHLDHVSGMPDVPHGTPIYAGPGETTPRSFDNLVVQGNTDRALEGQEPLQEWGYQPDADGAFAGILDVFGDGSLWALWVPGHTPGSTAYLVRTTHGPVLLTGDASHTAWGWKHHVEPGTFTGNGPKSIESLDRLEAFAAAHPNVEVRLGHQRMDADVKAAVK